MKSKVKSTHVVVPLPFAIAVIAMTIGGAGYVETEALVKAGRPKADKVSCIKCHTDKKTLQAIADKANDPLYLVHHGDLTVAELKKLTASH